MSMNYSPTSSLHDYRKIPVCNSISKTEYIRKRDDALEDAVAALAQIAGGSYYITAAPHSFKTSKGEYSETGKYHMSFPDGISLNVWLESDNLVPFVETDEHKCTSQVIADTEKEIKAIDPCGNSEYSITDETEYVVRSTLEDLYVITKCERGITNYVYKVNPFGPFMESLAFDVWHAYCRGHEGNDRTQLITKMALARHAREIISYATFDCRQIEERVLYKNDVDSLSILTFGQTSEHDFYSLHNFIDKPVEYWQENVRAARELGKFAWKLTKQPAITPMLELDRVPWDTWCRVGRESGLAFGSMCVLDGTPADDLCA